jgi:hypothetical protein
MFTWMSVLCFDLLRWISLLNISTCTHWQLK